MTKALLAEEAKGVEVLKDIHTANTLDAETPEATVIYEKWMRVFGFATDDFWC